MKRHKPLRRKKGLGQAQLDFSITRQDLFVFRVGRDWLVGAVADKTHRHVIMEEPTWPPRRHKVRLHPDDLRRPDAAHLGIYEHAAEHARHARQMEAELPALSGPVVARSGSSRAVPKRRRRYRDGAYLDFIRSLPCIGCAAPPPLDPHHDGEHGVGQQADDYDCVPLCRGCHRTITDTYCLPRLTRAATADVVQRSQNRCLKDWFALQRKLDAEAADDALGAALSGLPRLAAVAGALLALFLFTGVAGAAPPPDRPSSAAVLIARGRVQLRLGKPKVAELLARVALSRRFYPARAYVLLGDALAAQGKCGAARTEYLRALDALPGDTAALEGFERCRGDLPQAPPPIDRHPTAGPPPPRPVAQAGGRR